MIECKKGYHPNGSIHFEYYLLNGEFHRENGPAYITYYDNNKIDVEQYFKDAKLHREDGPAIIYYTPCGMMYIKYYYLDGILYSDKDITSNWEAFCKMQIFR